MFRHILTDSAVFVKLSLIYVMPVLCHSTPHGASSTREGRRPPIVRREFGWRKSKTFGSQTPACPGQSTPFWRSSWVLQALLFMNVRKTFKMNRKTIKTYRICFKFYSINNQEISKILINISKHFINAHTLQHSPISTPLKSGAMLR